MLKFSKYLIHVARQVMKAVLVVMLLQFIAPACFTIFDDQTSKDELAYTVQHNSLIVPQLLKEKEEDEIEFHKTVGGSLVELLDLSVHALCLHDVHLQFFVPSSRHPILNSQLFTLHHSLLI